MGVHPHEGLAAGLVTLGTFVEARPRLTLEFYEFGIILRKPREDGQTAYPVDPQEIAEALSSQFKALVQQQKQRPPTIATGLLMSDTLYVARSSKHSVVVEYRTPQVTGLWFEGSDDAYRAPLPGLILIRHLRKEIPSYMCYAVKQRPATLDEKLYRAPLPHMGNGSICWGTVPKPSQEAMESTLSLAEDWKLLLGSRFGSHTVNGLSKSHPKDIRQKFADLEKRKVRKYPVSDLVGAKLTMGELLGRLSV